MKDWDYYRNPGVPYPDERAYKQRRTEEINEAKMTAAERKQALEDLKTEAHNWFAREVKPYNEAQAKLEAEFWQDCRDEYGYEEFLEPAGCSALEHHAWQEGHSSGYPNVHSILCDLVELAKRLVKFGKPDALKNWKPR